MTSHNETYFSLILSQSQGEYLATSKYGIDRMKALVSLINLASTSEQKYHKKGFTTDVHIGQVVISEVELSHLWGCDRKTVSKILDKMNQLGLVATVQTNRTSIHTLLCVSAWIIGLDKIHNPFYVPLWKRDDKESRQDVPMPIVADHVADSDTLSPTVDGQCTSQSFGSESNSSIPDDNELQLTEKVCQDEPKDTYTVKMSRRKMLKGKKRKKK